MKQQTHLHPPELKSPPFGIHELYPYPQTLCPSPHTHTKKSHAFEDALATELQPGSVWMLAAGLTHALPPDRSILIS